MPVFGSTRTACPLHKPCGSIASVLLLHVSRRSPVRRQQTYCCVWLLQQSPQQLHAHSKACVNTSASPACAAAAGYGPGSYGYRPGMFVAGPYCQKCPRGYTSDGGEPMTTFCMPENSPGSIEVRSTPSGKNVPFQVAVSFDVPGGCDTTYKQVTVFVGSVPSGIRCDPVKLGSDCSAETTCEASKKGTFKLFASIKGVAGIVAGPTEVVVGGGGSGNDLPTNAVQLTIKTVFSATSLTRREALAAAILDLIKAEVTGVNVRVFNIKEGSIVITFAVEGTPDQVAAALEAIQAALPGIASEVVAFLASQEPPILNEQGQPISEADVTVNILVNGEPFVPAPPPPAGGGSSPPPPPNPNVVVQASAVATVPTTALTAATETALEAAILDALRTLPAASALITATGASVDSLDLTPGSPTNVVVRITVRASFAPTVVATIQQAGNQNLIRLAVWNTVAAFFQQTRVEFPISINAGILAN